MNATVQTQAANVIATLFHNEDIFSMPVFEGESNISILQRIKDAGYSMGATSLRRLMNGELAMTCGFSIKKEEPAAQEETKPEAPVEPAVEEPKVEEFKPVRAPFPTTPAKRTPAPAPVEEKKVDAPAQEASSQPAADDANKPKIKAMRRGTKNDQVFKMLCAGATIKEICEALKWSEGAVSSVVYWEPNYKGYGLDKVKTDGRGLVIYLTINGERINESQLVYSK
jgi:hypothetical protein